MVTRGGVRAAVRRDLKTIGAADPALASSTLAATALELAGLLDDPTNSATSKSMCAKALADVMKQLRELAPQEESNDDVDELTRRRADRISGRAAPEA